MGDDVDGPWGPLEVSEVAGLLKHLDVRWWFSGGLALELHLGRSWRSHDDTDVGVCRADAPALLRHLRRQGWQTAVAAGGRLRPWDGADLRSEANENNVWCRRADGPWALDVTVGDGDEDEWVYRRDRSLRLPWDRAVLRSPDGLPYLAPELQLLFKSTNPRPKDTIDAHEVIPALSGGQLALLHLRLPADHPWASLVVSRRSPPSATR